MSPIFHFETNIVLGMLAVSLTAIPLQAQADDIKESAESAHNELIQAMTNIDPLTQQTITTPTYNKTANARATLRRPVLKTWHAGGSNMAPLLFFEVLTLYCNPAGATKYAVTNINALGNETGFSTYTPCNGRICGPVYTYSALSHQYSSFPRRMWPSGWEWQLPKRNRKLSVSYSTTS